MQLIDKLAEALKAATFELNVIRARDGVPYTQFGHKSDVCAEYFSHVVDCGHNVLAQYDATYGRDRVRVEPRMGGSHESA